MQYTRIYVDDRGTSHFEDVQLDGHLRDSPVSSGASLYSDPIAAQAVVLRRVVRAHPPEPHVAPNRRFLVNLTGRMEVEVGDGEVRRFGPGDLLLVEDLEGLGHITREIGDEVRTSMFVELD